VDARDHLYSITFAGDTGWICGTYGRILKTTDGGATWKTQTSPTNEHLLKISAFDATHAVASGLNGVLLITDDGGETWRLSTPCGPAIISGAVFLSSASIVAAGYNGCVARSSDRGATW